MPSGRIRLQYLRGQRMNGADRNQWRWASRTTSRCWFAPRANSDVDGDGWRSTGTISAAASRTGSTTAAPTEPDDLRDRRKNLRSHRLPHLGSPVMVARWWATPMSCCFASGRRTATPSSTRSMCHTRSCRTRRRTAIDAGTDRCLCGRPDFGQMIGYIDADIYRYSLAIHDKFGFQRVGLLPGVAYRYGRCGRYRHGVQYARWRPVQPSRRRFPDVVAEILRATPDH